MSDRGPSTAGSGEHRDEHRDGHGGEHGGDHDGDGLAHNRFKAALADPAAPTQWGMFTSLANSVSAEICAGAGFDFLVIDGEHGPNDLQTLLVQLQAIAAYPVEPIVRLWSHDAVAIKRVLDLGSRTILVPMVDTADQAAAIVRATRYAPDGIRGMATARAARWGRIAGYHARANEQIAVVAQVESRSGLDNLAAICAVDGIDSVFVGPTDLSASLGLPGGNHPDTVDVVARALAEIAGHGVAPGVLSASAEIRDRYIAAGARMVAAGVDTAMLAQATSGLRSTLAN